MPRILIAGFQHETNTFGATKASFEEFLEADGWPGLLQGNDRDPRYLRTRSGFSGSPVCVDTRSGFVVSSFRCSGGTDALHSFSFDVSYIPIEELWMGGRPGLVFVGA